MDDVEDDVDDDDRGVRRDDREEAGRRNAGRGKCGPAEQQPDDDADEPPILRGRSTGLSPSGLQQRWRPTGG